MEQNIEKTFRIFCYLCGNIATFFDNTSEKNMDAHIQKCSTDHLQRYAEIYAEAFSGEPWNDAWTVEDAFVHVSEILESKQSYGLEYMVDGKVAGFILGTSMLFHNGRTFEINDLAVAVEYQRPVSSFLIEHPKGLILFDTGWHREMSSEGVFDKRAQVKSLGSWFLYQINQGHIAMVSELSFQTQIPDGKRALKNTGTENMRCYASNTRPTPSLRQTVT